MSNQPTRRANQSCQIEGCDKPAPYGYRKPGMLTSQPIGRRGYLWVCREHRAQAQRRQEAAL